MKTTGVKRIAERYVRALFDVAEAAGAVDQVEKDLNALGRALRESPEFRQFLTSPLLTRAAQARAMDAVLAKMGAGATTREFLKMVAEQKRLAILAEIIALYAAMAAKARGELAATLITAAALKPKDTASVAERLGRAYGRKINLDTKQDADLLGGMVLQIGSLQLDGSLKGKMNRLRNKLKVA